MIDNFLIDIKPLLEAEEPGSYSLERCSYGFPDPFIQSLWVGYQLGVVRAKLQANNKDEKKIPALCKAVDFEYSLNH
jgi:hypothetical protein